MRKIRLVVAIVSVLMAYPVQAGKLLMGIAEGVAEQSTFGDMQEKYQPLADYLAKLLKQKVVLESSQNIKSAMDSLDKGRYDLMYVRPSNVAGSAIRDNKYQLVAMAKGALSADFIVRKDHTFKKPEDILNKPIAMPAKNSLMAHVGSAMLRDMGGNPEKMKISYAHYQEAVSYEVEKKFADVGVVAPGQSKAWEKKGGIVLFKSKKLPFWSIIASPKMSKDEVSSMQKALIAMENTAEGKVILAKIGVNSWVAGNSQEYVDLMQWVGQ
jgi:phosphonate transport system substrate-binding protein